MVGTLVALVRPGCRVPPTGRWCACAAHAKGLTSIWSPPCLVGAVISAAGHLPLAWPHESDQPLTWAYWPLGGFQLAIPCVWSVRCGQVLQAPGWPVGACWKWFGILLLAWVGAGEAPGQPVADRRNPGDWRAGGSTSSWLEQRV